VADDSHLSGPTEPMAGDLGPKQDGTLSRKTFLAGAAASVGVASLPFAKAASGAVLAQRRSSKIGGTLRYLGFQGEDDRVGVSAFLKKYHVTIDSTYIGTNPEIITKIQAGGPGRYDVVVQFDRYFKPMLDLDMLEPLDLERIPNYADLYPRFRPAPWTVRNGHVYGIPGWFGFGTFNYRADLVKPAPTSLEILADPRYRGKIAIRSDSTDNVLFVGPELFGYTFDGSKYTHAMLDHVLSFFKEVKKNTKTFATSFGEVKDLLVRGDIVIGSPGWEYINVQARQQHVNVTNWIKAKGPLVAWTDSFAILKGSNNIDTAYAWINAMLSPHAMATSGTSLGSYVSNRKAPPLIQANLRSGMHYSELAGRIERAHWGTLPPPSQSNSKYATLQDFNNGWTTVWG